MRKILAVAAIAVASIGYGIGVGQTGAFTASGELTDPEGDIVRVADNGDHRNCPFRDGRSEETSA
jgi:hypothetical protein